MADPASANESPTPKHDEGSQAVAIMANELAQLREQAEQARSALAMLRHDVLLARGGQGLNPAAQLVQANEQLVIAMLRTQVEAENLARTLEHQKVADELRQEGQRLVAENRQIQAASQLKSEFLSTMSHELRTPLNAIIGFSDLLALGRVTADAAKCQEFGRHIATSGRHLLRLINDILDLSKIEAGKFELYPELVDLPKLVHEVTEILAPLAQQKNLSLQADISPDLNDLVLDSLRLKQVLYNYLSNAIKFTPEGGSVTVRARPCGDECFRLEVEDTGIGIAPADQSKLFMLFQQLDGSSTRKHQGTGLGLALTRKLVEAQGGSVGLSSTPGVGSVFHLVLRRNLAV